MDLAALNRQLDGGDPQAALVEALARLPGQSGRERVDWLLFIARCHGVIGSAVPALQFALEARVLAAGIGDARAQAEATLLAGAAHQRVDGHGAALGCFTEAESLLEGVEDDRLRHGLFRRMGVVCSILGRHDEALDLIRRSIEILPADAPEAERLASRNSWINACTRRIDAAPQDEAARRESCGAMLPELESLVRDAAAAGNRRLALLAEANCGSLLVKAGRHDEGIARLEAHFARLAEAGLRTEMGAAKGSIGKAHLAQGRHEAAIAALREALGHLEGGSVQFQRDVWDAIATAHEALDQPREALAAVKAARALEKGISDTAATMDLEKRQLRSQMSRVTAEFARLADEDALTGLANRRAGERALADALADPGNAPIALLFLDIDRFKGINDRHGHATGDRVLRECAHLMRQGSRARDLAARWGGEEFLLLLADADLARAVEVAERLRVAVARFDWGTVAPGLVVTLSIGIATSRESPAADPAALVALADRRLYKAKEAGRDRVVAG
ncbi:MAG: GGDEF domain-containing protein [Betaproteobacteria bacterium]|nr:GGDEF domain-containing protein [Betaproteobacteria bacterium]